VVFPAGIGSDQKNEKKSQTTRERKRDVKVRGELGQVQKEIKAGFCTNWALKRNVSEGTGWT